MYDVVRCRCTRDEFYSHSVCKQDVSTAHRIQGDGGMDHTVPGGLEVRSKQTQAIPATSARMRETIVSKL